MFNLDFQQYLFEFWKQNFIGVCQYCKYNKPCLKKDCSKYEEFPNAELFEIKSDGTKQKIDNNWFFDCTDLDFGTCPLLEKTYCNNCLSNDRCNFRFNDIIPDNYEVF